MANIHGKNQTQKLHEKTTGFFPPAGIPFARSG